MTCAASTDQGGLLKTESSICEKFYQHIQKKLTIF